MKGLVCIAAAACMAFTSPVVVAQSASMSRSDVEQIQKLNYFYRFLNNNYVDDVALDEVVEQAIINTLSQLDPHSVYLTADEMTAAKESLNGEFSGIGVEYAVYRDTVIVVNTICGSPASAAGILPDDRIVSVDGESVVGISRADVPRRLRGERGSIVRLDVVRGGRHLPAFTLKRDNIPLNTVAASYRDGSIGYVRVDRFAHTTVSEFARAVSDLGAIKGLIVDLRGNGGGVLEAALGMAGMFLHDGAKIVSTSGRAGGDRHYRASGGGELTELPLAVLIDEESASASEIVAGALQDWDRAVVIGRPSFGKGLVQRQVEFGDGSAMRLTVARYRTPSGRIIQRPYRNGHSSEYYQSHYERYAFAADTVPVNDSLLFYTLKLGRKVYGGGGIAPDIIVEADTAAQTQYFHRLAASGAIGDYQLAYVASHRDSLLRRYPDLSDYDERFSLTDEDIADLIDMARERGAELDDVEYDTSKDLLALYVKALIAERIYPRGAFYYIYNRRYDNVYSEAVDIITRLCAGANSDMPICLP